MTGVDPERGKGWGGGGGRMASPSTAFSFLVVVHV